MPPVTGIYASMLPALLAVLFSALDPALGPGRRAELPAGGGLAHGLAEPGSARWVELAVWLALLLRGCCR